MPTQIIATLIGGLTEDFIELLNLVCTYSGRGRMDRHKMPALLRSSSKNTFVVWDAHLTEQAAPDWDYICVLLD